MPLGPTEPPLLYMLAVFTSKVILKLVSNVVKLNGPNQELNSPLPQ